jgi:stage V sporulation protein S
MSLDDVIKKSAGSRSNRSRAGGSAVVRGGRPPSARRSAAPYAKRLTGEAEGTMSGASVTDLAASGNASLKVSATSKPNTVAGAICNIVREAPGGAPPSVLATGPAALNQAIKAICIARKYLLEESPPIDIVCKPTFEQVRAGPPGRSRRRHRLGPASLL